jgi:DUF35 OB-fold domain, acyl-CoA-associated
MIRDELIAGSRCPRCRSLVVPPAASCPFHGLAMEPAGVPAVGDVISFTTLHSPPEGFRAPLHIALVELEGGARIFCHSDDTKGIKIGSSVSIEEQDSIFYFSSLGVADRARLFWRRAGARGEKAAAISKALLRGLWKGQTRGPN